MEKFLHITFVLLYLATSIDAARILASVGTPSYSHQVAFRTIWKELAMRGHEIVLLTTDPMEHIENIKQIDTSSSYNVMNEYSFSSSMSNKTNSIWQFVTKSVVAIGEAQRFQLHLPEVQELIHNSSEHFDLLMLEVVFPIHIGLVERFNAPVIGLVSLDAHRLLHKLMGNDDHSVLHPLIGLSLSVNPTLLERTVKHSKMHIISRGLAFLVICSWCLPEGSQGARILASVGTPSYSHQVAFRPIWKELASRGHEIVLLTTDPMEDTKNIRQIDLHSSYKIMNRYKFSTMVSDNNTNSFLSFVLSAAEAMGEAQKQQLLHPEVQELINNSSEHFDLIMMEVIFPIHLGFVERFKTPLIGLTSLDPQRLMHKFMGNDDHMILHPSIGMPLAPPLTFPGRVISVLFNGFMYLYGAFVVNPMIDDIIRNVFGENSRSINELMKEIDMLFINVNPIIHPIRAITPNTIMFGGGIHVDSVPKPLPEDIQKFLDNATEGAIYFSLGSNVKSALIKKELRQMFIETLKELPYKVLWKFENEELPNKPDNVMIQKWVPQSDVLKHPNIKVFVTQCGLQSMEEAIMNHVPLVGLPFFADQPANAKMMHNKGFGIHLEHTSLTKEQFKETIMEVVNNPKYKDRTIEIAELTADVEMAGLEKVVWWTEYVIRNKGAKLFKNPIRDLPLYQYYLLDVIGFVGLVCFIVTYGTIKISLLIFKILRKIIYRKSKKE